MKGYLKTTGWVFKLQPQTTTVGRHRDCDLCLQNGGVEEHHALIEWSESQHCFVLSDLNSANGTYVNDCCIHNAAVRLTPGDELHFGYGGSTYQLSVDSPSLLPCPPQSDWTTCQSSLQLIEEPPLNPSPSSPSFSSSSQLPLLPCQSSAPVAWVWGGSSVTPHPPSRARPASAGAKRNGQQSNPSGQGTTSRRAGSWTGNTGSTIQQRNKLTSQSFQTMQHLLQEKEERLLRLGDEIHRLAVFEGESQRKNGVIAGLRDEVSALRHQLTQSQAADTEIRHMLRSLETDISDKKEEIQQFKEQMVDLQKGSSEGYKLSLTDRDLKISNLRGQIERLKKESSSASGLVTSMQKDLTSREKQALKLAAEVDRLRQDIQHKDIQLGVTATKVSKMSKKHQEELLNRENEMTTLRKSMEKLENTLREKQRFLEQQTMEKDSLRCRLERKIEEQASLLAEVESDKQTQHQRTKVELELMQAQVENIRGQLLRMIRVDPGNSTSQDALLSDQQVLDRVASLLEDRESLMTKAVELEGRLKEDTAEQDRAAEDTERLRSRLDACQSQAQEACSADLLERAMATLQEESVPPSLAWVQASALAMMDTHLSLLQIATQTLMEAGIDASDATEGEQGVISGIRTLGCAYRGYKDELQCLKAELEKLQGSEAQSKELQDQLSSTREELEQQMAMAQHQEGARLKELEELRGEVDVLRQAQASLQQEAQTQEAGWRTRLEERERTEEEWREQVKEAQEREVEGKREMECHRVQEEEYREQVRQHAHTIVAMEQRWLQSRQRVQGLRKERDSLGERMRELEGRLESSTSPMETTKAAEVAALEDVINSLRPALAQSQLEAQNHGDIIVALSRDLAAANARITDMTGELSEQQKLELEQHKALVVDQRVQLSTLTQKLTQMSQLVEQKGEELKRVREELRLSQVDLEKRVSAEREMSEQQHHHPEQSESDHCSVVACLPQHAKDVATVSSSGKLAKQGSKCRGHRHEEVIQHQREALSEMRARIKAMETWPLKRFGQQIASKKQARSATSKLDTQRSAVVKEFMTSTSGWPLPGVVGEESLERTARLDLSDALDLSERTYLDLVRALCEVLELSEDQLEGCVSLHHLPQEETIRLSSLRHRDLGMFQTRMALQHSQAQRRETMLQAQASEINTLSKSQAAGLQLQARLDSLRAELEMQSQESSLLREALRRTQSRLDREIGLNTAIKSRKTVSLERPQRKSGRVASHSCGHTEAIDKVAAKTASLQERLKKREYEVETLKRQLREKEREFSNMATKLVSLQQQRPQQASPLPVSS